MYGQIGISLHVELAIILVRNLEAKPFIESHRRVDFHNSQEHSMIGACGVGDQT
jgi:hypothetical protein